MKKLNILWPEYFEGNIFEEIIKIRNIKDTNLFFSPTLSDINQTNRLYGVYEASKVILDAINSKKRIWIHGDFDVDGIASTSILWRYLYRDLGANVMPYIPSRFDEGYGLSKDSIEAILGNGADLIISVDCGIKDLAIVSKYKDQVDFIITDHHTLLTDSSKLEEGSYLKVGEFFISSYTKAVVHPKIDSDGFNEICGTAVVWKLICAINELSDKKIDVYKYLEFVAIATICDMMPLEDENRTFVKLGVDKLSRTENEGIKALCDVAGIDLKNIKSSDIGFGIGPRVNASGRLETAMDAVKLFSSNNISLAKNIALQLNDLNIKRRDLTLKYTETSREKIDGEGKVYFILDKEVPEGIVGLIAGRLARDFYAPVLMATESEGIIKGSARSIDGINIAGVLKLLDSYLLKHGGHSGAAGFSLEPLNIEKFKNALYKHINDNYSDDVFSAKLKVDINTSVSNLNIDLVNKIKGFEPYGISNEEVVFGFKGLKVINKFYMGKDNKHIKVIFADQSDETLSAVMFNYPDYFVDLLESGVKIFNVVGYLDINKWNGTESLQLKLIEIEG